MFNYLDVSIPRLPNDSTLAIKDFYFSGEEIRKRKKKHHTTMKNETEIAPLLDLWSSMLTNARKIYEQVIVFTGDAFYFE